jgi:hypothetical protein
MEAAMKPALLHQIWECIDCAETQLLLKMDNPELVEWIYSCLLRQQCLSAAEEVEIRVYLHDKVSLIRDLARSHQSVVCPVAAFD